MSVQLERLRVGRKGTLRLLALLPILSVLSCAGASLVNVWRDPQYSKPVMRNLLIVAMNNDPTARRLWEGGFVQELEKHGVSAMPSYRPFPDAAPDIDHLVQTVRSDGYDGVLVTHRLATQIQKSYMPGYTTVEPRTVLDPWGHYATSYRDVHHRGYVETDRVVRHETELWSTTDGDRMVWSAVGEIIAPGSGEAIRSEIAKRVVPELIHAGLIPSGARSVEEHGV